LDTSKPFQNEEKALFGDSCGKGSMLEQTMVEVAGWIRVSVPSKIAHFRVR
jgi:hypothetical protein